MLPSQALKSRSQKSLVPHTAGLCTARRIQHQHSVVAGLAIVVLALWLGTGCHTAPESAQFSPVPATEAQPQTNTVVNTLVLHEGDTVRISFPGAPDLNTTAAIRRDGVITLPLIGEFKAGGLTPGAMEKELIKLYGPQLQTKEVTVSVEASAFPVYVTGAVLRPGKIMSDRPLTALEAVMEAGIDYSKANLKAVNVIRHENGRAEHHKLNLKAVLAGAQVEPFNLKPSDIIYVPERFSWF